MIIKCDGGNEAETCGCTEFNLNFKPPMSAEAICANCGYTQEIGGANR